MGNAAADRKELKDSARGTSEGDWMAGDGGARRRRTITLIGLSWPND